MFALEIEGSMNAAGCADIPVVKNSKRNGAVRLSPAVVVPMPTPLAYGR
jgi:hypothetical protein